ncbi:MAG TPA: cysteine desulfurase family protein [Thermodesulfobacteriota bacterium]|nr:cysteine desulfurase family protein [Thermodesulfobacteriota bacterium]
MKKIYLDYNATTPLDPRVLDAMMPYLGDDFGNPSSIHSFGMRGKGALDRAREQVASLINASPREIVFTSGGSESNNYAVKGVALADAGKKGNHLVTTRVEHESVLEAFRFLEKTGFRVTYLGVDASGAIDLDELRDSISDETILVSCIFANNETGTVMPIAEIARIVKEKGAVFHTDAVQAAGKIDINMNEIPADLLTVSAHKFYGSKGAGALYIRDGINKKVGLLPMIHGGGQERGSRSGTENVPAIAGMGMASEISLREMREDERRIRPLRDGLWESLSASIAGIRLNGDMDGLLWNTLNVFIDGVSGDSLSMALDLEGVAVSTGSACSEGKVDPSHVLMAMGLSRTEAASSLRISLGRFTGAREIDTVAEILERAVERIREARGGSSRAL